MPTQPQVSVVVPCLNPGSRLIEAIDSVQAQTYRDFEIVIVDDGSTQAETRRVFESYERSGHRVIHHQNQGSSAARNAGTRATRSPYVTCLDPDDRLLPTMLEKSVAVLDRDPAIGFVSHWVETFGGDQGSWTPQGCDLQTLVDVNTVSGAALMRRECFDAAGGFDEAIRDGGEDWDFWISVIEAGFRAEIIQEVLYESSRRSDSRSRLAIESDQHARLYRDLARKHPRSFRQFLPQLLERRERDITQHRAQIHNLEREYEEWLSIEVASRSDTVARLTRNLERANAEESRHQNGTHQVADAVVAEATDRLAAEQTLRLAAEDAARAAVERVEVERAQRVAAEEAQRSAEEALERARRTTLTLDADFTRVQDEVLDLRMSMSWRLTAPLRAVYARVFGRRGQP